MATGIDSWTRENIVGSGGGNGVSGVGRTGTVVKLKFSSYLFAILAFRKGRWATKS